MGATLRLKVALAPLPIVSDLEPMQYPLSSQGRRRFLPDPVRLLVFGLILSLCATVGVADSVFPPLNPTPKGKGKSIDGKFIWVDLFTADLKVASDFYTRTFGWTAEKFTVREVDHILMRRQGMPVAGLVLRKRVRGEDASGLWVGYISVQSVSSALAVVKREGGKSLVEPGVVTGRGAHAILSDPEGSIVGLLDSTSGDPPDTQPDPGEWAWSGLLSAEPEKAAAFYKEVGSYDATEQVGQLQGGQIFLVSDRYARAGITAIEEGEEVSPGWLHFIRVDNLADALERAKANGATVLLPETSDQFDGNLAIIEDPVGAAVGLIEWTSKKEGDQS